jgi:hypothetical protein
MGVALGMIFYEVARKLSGVSGGDKEHCGKIKRNCGRVPALGTRRIRTTDGRGSTRMKRQE